MFKIALGIKGLLFRVLRDLLVESKSVNPEGSSGRTPKKRKGTETEEASVFSGAG